MLNTLKGLYILIVIVVMLPIVALLLVLKSTTLLIGYILKPVFIYLLSVTDISKEIAEDMFVAIEDNWEFKSLWEDIKNDWQ